MQLTAMTLLDKKMAWSLCGIWPAIAYPVNHLGSRKTLDPAKACPRRSSDVAAAVWLICEEAKHPDIISQSIMALIKPSALSRLPVTADQPGNACTQLGALSPITPPQKGFCMAQHSCGLAISVIAVTRCCSLLPAVTVQVCLTLEDGKKTLPNQCSSTDRLCLTFVGIGLK